MTHSLSFELGAGALLFAGFVLVISAAQLFKKLGFPSEFCRKFVHLIGGAPLLALPWLFDSPLVPGALCLLFTAVFVLSKSQRKLVSIHDVKRPTSGAALFPVAAFLTFILAPSNVAFVVAIALMVVGDTLAAAVGKRFGTWHFSIFGQTKTVEGSSALLVFAFAVSFAFTGHFGLALAVAIAASVAEAVSVRGLDNLTVPLTTLSVFAVLS